VSDRRLSAELCIVLKTILSILPIMTPAAFSQTVPRLIDFNQHFWSTYSGDHRVSGPWGIHLEGQWRRADFGTEWQQLLLRPGLNFAVTPSIQITLGYAYIKTIPYGDFPARIGFPEHRIYQQGQVTRRWRSLRLQHRVRFEQRFLQYPDPQPRSWTYQNRFRYLIKLEIPLVTDASGEVEWYVPAFNEVLIGIPPNYGARPFDQNRLFLGLGRALPGARVEVGYMKQFLGQRNGRIFEFNNTLLLQVTSNVALSGLWSD
jgi:hypothetical protein